MRLSSAAATAVAEELRLRASYARDTAKTVRGLAHAARDTMRTMEYLYLSPMERLRVLASVSGLGMAMAGLVAGVPAYLAAYRIAGNMYSLLRAGRKVNVGEIGLALMSLLEELV